MVKVAKQTQQVLRYRMKQTVEVLEIVVASLTVIATPLTFDKDGEPLTFHVDLFINEWFTLAVHDVCDWHEFESVEV